MTSIPRIARVAEELVRDLVDELGEPRRGECLCCYVVRLLDVAPCDGTLRHAVRYRDATAPRATALAERLMRVGAGCDCEIFWNGYVPWIVAESLADDEEIDLADLPPCSGVQRGSIRPCRNWVRIRRGG